MELNVKSRHGARFETETKPKEDQILSQRISRKAAEPGADTNGSRSKTGNAPRIALAASGREDEPRTYSWKDPAETEEFSLTWTVPEPFIAPERHAQNCSDVFQECISNIDDNKDLLPATCTASHSAPVCLDTGKGTFLFEPQSSYSSQPTLYIGEASSNTFSSTWVEYENPGTGIYAGSDDKSPQENRSKTETVIWETAKRHSEGDTGLGSFESSPEKAEGDSDDEEHQPGGQGDFEEEDFDVDDMNDEDNDDDDEDLPSLQDIYEECQAMRMKRFSGDLYNIWCVQMTVNAKINYKFLYNII